MKRLSLLVAAAAAALAMFAMPVLAALPDDGPIAIERLDCPAADVAAADLSAAGFVLAITAPAVERFSCDADLLAATGLCLVEVGPARVGFAFVQPPDPVRAEIVADSCLFGRSTSG